MKTPHENMVEQIKALVEALEGVIRVADRKTVEFDKAREALTHAPALVRWCEEMEKVRSIAADWNATALSSEDSMYMIDAILSPPESEAL